MAQDTHEPALGNASRIGLTVYQAGVEMERAHAAGNEALASRARELIAERARELLSQVEPTPRLALADRVSALGARCLSLSSALHHAIQERQTDAVHRGSIELDRIASELRDIADRMNPRRASTGL